MNQVFAFKAWDTVTSTMYDSIYELYFERGVLKEVIFSKEYIAGEEEVKWEFARLVELLPFIGICDVDDNAIHKGDIVQFTAFDRSVIGVVKWDIDDGFPGYYIIDSDGSGMIWSFDYDDLKIIGNKFENPELLKGE